MNLSSDEIKLQRNVILSTSEELPEKNTLKYVYWQQNLYPVTQIIQITTSTSKCFCS